MTTSTSEALIDQMSLISAGKYADETQLVSTLLKNPPYDAETASAIEVNAEQIVNSAIKNLPKKYKGYVGFNQFT